MMDEEEKRSPAVEHSKALTIITQEKSSKHIWPKTIRNILHDTPIYQYIWKKGYTNGWDEGFSQGRAEGRAQGWAEGHTEGREDAHQQLLQILRRGLIKLVQTRFPKLRTLTRGQAALIEDPTILEDLFVKIAMAQTVREAQDYLLTWEPGL